MNRKLILNSTELVEKLNNYIESKPAKEVKHLLNLFDSSDMNRVYSEAELNSVLEFLSNKPYIEVADLIATIAKDVKVLEEPKVEASLEEESNLEENPEA